MSAGAKLLRGCPVERDVLATATRIDRGDKNQHLITLCLLCLLCKQDKCAFREKYLEGSALEGPGTELD